MNFVGVHAIVKPTMYQCVYICIILIEYLYDQHRQQLLVQGGAEQGQSNLREA